MRTSVDPSHNALSISLLFVSGDPVEKLKNSQEKLTFHKFTGVHRLNASGMKTNLKLAELNNAAVKNATEKSIAVGQIHRELSVAVLCARYNGIKGFWVMHTY